MRQAQFPFAKYREWGESPTALPVLDAEGVAQFTRLQDIFRKRKPILDDLTGYYQFFPSENGALAYVDGAMKKRPINVAEIIPPDTYAIKEARKRQHIADTAELATALFWSAAVMRSAVLGEALASISDQKPVSERIAVYSADAIADLGFCMVHPVDIDHTGEDHGAGLKKRIEAIAPGVGQALLDFGNYATNDLDALVSFDGVVALQAAYLEQDRRIAHWSPRHNAVFEAFPDTKPSQEILYMAIDFPEMFHMHDQLRESA